MSDLRDLYQELIIDHSRSPRNFGKIESADLSHEGFNPLCGDKVTIYLCHNQGIIQQAQFEGSGCAISIATASLMTEALEGKTKSEIAALFSEFQNLVTKGAGAEIKENSQLEKLLALAGVAEYPMRVKCATLAWHTALAALEDL